MNKAVAVHGPEANLLELRARLLRHTATLLVAIGAALATFSLPGPVFHFDRFAMLLALAALGAATLLASRKQSTAGRHLMVWGSTTGLVLAMWWFPHPWIPLAGLILPFIASVIVSKSGFAAAGVVGVAAVCGNLLGVRHYPLLAVLPLLAAAAAAAWLLVRTFYTALGWAWTMEQRADRLLEEARDRRGELSRTLNSLEKTNWILRRTQRELILARQQADEARLVKEQFAANVSHELRTPLNLILGFSELMCLSSEVYGKTDWPDLLRRDIRQIHRNSRHLLDMINDILDLSRLEVVGFTLNREPAAIGPLVHEALGIVEDLFRNRPVRLEARIEPDLPLLAVDPLRIRQVLLNLLNNAARFTEQGCVTVGVTRQEGSVVISISDTGLGIPPGEIAHLFEEYHQLDRSLNRRHGGAGLGLAISKHFVEAHDGRIWVESEEGVGSTFSFSLPIPGEGKPLSRLRYDRPLCISHDLEDTSVLVVDPDPAIASMVRRHLEHFQVVHWRDVDSLEQAIALHHPRAVIVNVEPSSGLRGSLLPQSPVPVIECSLASQSWVAQGPSIFACLTKPISPAALLRELDRVGDVHNVLVIDDDRGFCQLVERMLQASGRDIAVRRAYDGTRGLEALGAHRPDLLLLDLVMPGMDGYQLLAEMQSQPTLSGVPVVVLTATSVSDDMLAGRTGTLAVHRSDGLRSGEVLRCLRAVINELEPHYDDGAETELMPG